MIHKASIMLCLINHEPGDYRKSVERSAELKDHFRRLEIWSCCKQRSHSLLFLGKNPVLTHLCTGFIFQSCLGWSSRLIMKLCQEEDSFHLTILHVFTSLVTTREHSCIEQRSLALFVGIFVFVFVTSKAKIKTCGLYISCVRSHAISSSHSNP